MNKFFDPKIPLAGIREKKIRVKIKDISIFTTALLISKNKQQKTQKDLNVLQQGDSWITYKSTI